MNIRRHIEVMKSLYEENDYPSERLIREKSALDGFTLEFNSRTMETFSAEDIAAELERIRKDKSKTGGLPRLGRSFGGPLYVASDNVV